MPPQQRPTMKPAGPSSPAGGLSVQDVLFVLFRHKWMIFFLTLLGLGAAAFVYRNQVPLYASQAKLLVRYVVERSAVDPFEAQRNPDGRPNNPVILTEIEILRSGDLAADVAAGVGPERLVPEAAPDTDPRAVAGVVGGGLQVTAPRGGNVIHVTYQHANPELAVEVLNELVQKYFVRHLEIHRSTGAFDYVSKETDQARSRLRQAEEELNKLKLESGIMSLEDTMAALEKRRSEVQTSLQDARAQFEAQRAKVESLEANQGIRRDGGMEDLPEIAPPDAAAAALADQAAIQASLAARSDYQALAKQLDFLRQRRIELLSRYTPTSRSVLAVERQIESVKSQGLALIDQHPELIGLKEEDAAGSGDLDVERAQLVAHSARVDTIETQLEDIGREFERVFKAGMAMNELERRRKLAEGKYNYLESSLDKARVDEALDPSKIPNISIVQHPSPPTRVTDPKAMKIIAALAASGLAVGIGLALLIELVLDRRIKRPAEISARLQLPLLLSIPYFRIKDRSAGHLPLGEESDGDPGSGGGLIVPGGGNVRRSERPHVTAADRFLFPYTKAIRDRIIFNFEINNVVHRPKLVALTGLSREAGTSTLAAGVAKAFAEGDRMKVLLVDLNPGRPGGEPLLGDRAPQSLEGALRLAQGGDHGGDGSPNLFFASAGTAAGNGHGPAPIAPMQLYGLIPKLQASDFDYIIFDMPPLDPTSPTLAMAGFMDKVLLVLDAESTSREQLQWGYTELARGKADVSCIFNKARTHAPRWIEGG